MLTVLHRGPDGSERIFEAESVSRFPAQGEQTCPPLGEIQACGVTGDFPGNTCSLDISPPFGAVFVMNRHGTTIARFTNPE